MDEGQSEDFRDFYRSRYRRLLGFAYLLCGDRHHAEDLLQTAMIRVHRHWRRVSRMDHPEAYVRRTLTTVAIASWRRSRLGEYLTSVLPERAVPDHAESYPVRDQLWNAVQRLPPRMRAVLVLRYFEDLPEREVAHQLGCSVGTVKTQASRAMTRLRAQLTEEGVDR